MVRMERSDTTMAKEGRNKMTMLVVFLLGGTCVIAVIVAAVAISREGPTDMLIEGAYDRQYTDNSMAKGKVNVATDNALRGQPLVVISRQGGTREQTWNIAIGHDYGVHSYIDNAGFIAGFTKDLIYEVCKAAQMDCRLIWDTHKNCWDSEPGKHSMGGEGLLGGWYDACAGYAPTVARRQVFDFSASHLAEDKAYFFIKPGKQFNSSDISNKKIVFLDSWASDEKCLAKQNNIKGGLLAVSNVKHVNETADAVAMIEKGQADAIFGSNDGLGKYVDSSRLELVTDKAYDCESAGAAMMTRKDSMFNSYWNEGLRKLRSIGRLSEMCSRANSLHRLEGRITCIN